MKWTENQQPPQVSIYDEEHGNEVHHGNHDVHDDHNNHDSQDGHDDDDAGDVEVCEMWSGTVTYLEGYR